MSDKIMDVTNCLAEDLDVEPGDKVYFKNTGTNDVTVTGLKLSPSFTPAGSTKSPSLPGVGASGNKKGSYTVPAGTDRSSRGVKIPGASKFDPTPSSTNEYDYTLTLTGCSVLPDTGSSPKMKVG